MIRRQSPSQAPRRGIEIAIIMAVLVLVVGVVFVETRPGGVPTQAAHGQASPATAAATTSTAPTLPADYPPEKATAEANEAREMATAQAVAPTKPTTPQPPPASAESTPALQAGIDNETRQGPFSPSEFLVRNLWQGPVGDGWLLVYAGATKNVTLDGSVGLAGLRVYSVTPAEIGSYDVRYIGTFLAPTLSSPLTIVDVSENRMHLRTDDGDVVSFDLRTRIFGPPEH
jgi:hypothetical protein